MLLPVVAELNRRRVFRALVGYGIGAFAVLQIIEPIMHGMHWPDAVLSYVVVGLAVGFPIVVTLAWIFDVGTSGIQRTGPASLAGLNGARLAGVLVTIGLLAAAPGLLWYFVVVPRRLQTIAAPAEAPAGTLPSIAVLPLVNLSRDPEQEYFSDGLAEEILNALAQVEGVRVAGRTSSFSFKGKNEDLRSIGQKLGVATVLEGSVRRQGDRVRISAQLINVADGFHLWSQNFDRNLQDIFAVQEEIANAVVEGLKVKLLPGAKSALKDRRTINVQSYDQYLLAMQVLNTYSREDALRARKALESAVALDPGYGPAWSGLSMAFALLSDWAPIPAEQRALQQQALAAANRAVELAPDLAETWARRGLWRMQISWDWQGAREDIDRALALNPRDVLSNDAKGRLHAVFGQLPEAIRSGLKAAESDRLNSSAWARLSNYHLGGGELELARRALEKAEHIAPDSVWSEHGILDLLEGRPEKALGLVRRYAAVPDSEDGRLILASMAEHSLGHAKESQQALDALIARWAEVDAYQIAEVYAWRNEKERAVEWLERAHAQHDGGFVAVLPNNCSLKCNPLLRNLRSEPRYTALLEKMNLPVE